MLIGTFYNTAVGPRTQKQGTRTSLQELSADATCPGHCLCVHPCNPFHLCASVYRYTDEQVAAMAKVAVARSLFGGICNQERVLQELSAYSDFSLHCFAGERR